MNTFGKVSRSGATPSTYALTVTRNKGWYGRARKVKLMADRTPLGTLGAGETATFEVPRGARTLLARMDWGSSDPFDLSFVEPGEHIDLVMWFTLNPLRLFAIPKIPARFEARP